jgi:hypothetical protein
LCFNRSGSRFIFGVCIGSGNSRFIMSGQVWRRSGSGIVFYVRFLCYIKKRALGTVYHKAAQGSKKILTLVWLVFIRKTWHTSFFRALLVIVVGYETWKHQSFVII